MTEADIVVIGAGAAGIAAARRLEQAGLATIVLEARSRLGGRAWTRSLDGFALDLGCGWLHSAPENEWAAIAAARGFTIDTQDAPWQREALALNFSPADQEDFAAARIRFYERLDAAAEKGDRPAADLLDGGCRWNALLNAVSTYANGVELDRLSTQDSCRYRDLGVNWRVREGYGTLISASAAGLDIRLDCAVTLVDHAGPRLRIETARGTVTARAAIVTVPTSVIASEALRFRPALPDKLAAAAALPLGLADKLFLRIDGPEKLPPETRFLGAIDRTATASYHLRPFGWPVIEGYFGGELARALEAEGEKAFAQFAMDEFAAVFGNGIRKHLHLIAASAWAQDPLARGSYSYAKVGCAEARRTLAAPVDDRLFFAGEACSTHDFSTAHGAFRTGVAAADVAAAALRTSVPSARRSGATSD